MHSHREEILAYDREKKIYKQAYVEHFKKVRHFPALASIGQGHTDGESIVLIQEGTSTSPRQNEVTNNIPRNSKYDYVESRLIPTDPLDDMFVHSGAPLTNFRAEVMCKHTKARRESSQASSTPSRAAIDSNDSAWSRFGNTQSARVFKPASTSQAKTTIERKLSYDRVKFQDKKESLREETKGKRWVYNNTCEAKEKIRNRTFFNVPEHEGIKADRKYTREFIRMNVQAYQASRKRQKEEHALLSMQTSAVDR